MNIDNIVKKLLEAKDAYYNSDVPLMSDAEFDKLEESLKEIDPENPYFQLVGIVNTSITKIKHQYPMLSMQKCKDIEGVRKWTDKILLDEFDYCVQPKIDGLSASCYYEKGKLKYVSTRGDGLYGQDITHVAQYISDIPLEIDTEFMEIEVRGELYLPKDTEFNTENKALRNSCVGLINRKENRDDLQYVRFVTYQALRVNELTKETDKIDYLKKLGFHIVNYIKATSIVEIEKYYISYLKKNRELWKYETDGLIVIVNNNELFSEIDSRWIVNHHHHYSIAIKPPSEARKTTLENIEWQVSRQGALIPVAIFRAVKIGGATLTRASLHNYENVKKMKLAIGDQLLVERANDVIPYVKENLDYSEDKIFDDKIIPVKCPSCNSDVNESGVNLKCDNIDCPEINIQKIIYWVKSSNVENVAEASIRQLYQLGKIKGIKDLYQLTEDDFSEIEGYAEKKIANFIQEIRKSREMTAQDLISKIGISLVQKKSLTNLGIITIDDFFNFNDDQYVVGKNIIEWKKNQHNIDFLKELISNLTLKDQDLSNNKRKVCMTGKGHMPRKELIKVLEEMGYEFIDSITSETDILICDDINSSSNKIKKAKKLNIEIVDYNNFFTFKE